MGLFNPFKSNHARIAETTTKFYIELTRKYNDRFDDEISLLATAGVLDAQWYVFATNKTHINVSEIINMARGAVVGGDVVAQRIIRTIPEQRQLKNWDRRKISPGDLLSTFAFPPESDPLTNFIVSLEVRIFIAESPRVNPNDIMIECSKKMSTITKVICETKERYTGERRISSDTAQHMQSPQFKQLRKELGISETVIVQD